MSAKAILAALAIASPVLYFIHLHHDLSRKVHHTKRTGTITASELRNIDSIPSSAAIEEKQCHMFYDYASKAVPTAHLPAPDRQTHLLTTLLRHNMTQFSRLPQAYVMRLMSSTPAERQSFDTAYIQSLDFNEGDIVCGMYKVALRTEGKLEFALKPMGPVNGRLVVTVERGDNESVFSSETLMWQDREIKTALPLERRLAKWMHELAAWWLLDSGTRYLVKSKEDYK